MRVPRSALSLGVLVAGGLAAAGQAMAPNVSIGERPTIETHLDQSRIEAGETGLAELLRHGRLLFDARFNVLDGQGRPLTTGHGIPRPPHQPAFIRTSGPDANSCSGCHFQPQIGGVAGFANNAFILAQERDPVITSVEARHSNERNPMSLMGTGAIEMLAREMSAELIAIRNEAGAEARAAGVPVRRRLEAKGVSFGAITVLPDGRVDPGEIEGVDWDLVIRPFLQKGVMSSLRELANTALNQHHGLQSVERFGQGLDADGDGKVDELTVGDVTSLTVFLAALGTPGRMLPSHPARREAAERGERLFAGIGCASCHRPELILDNPVFTDPGPYNPPGNLQPSEVKRPAALDLTRDTLGPHLERLPDGRAVVRAFTDLKRHDLNDDDYQHFANEKVPQGTLNARVAGNAFTIPAQSRPTGQFLTRRLWDAGNSDPYGHRGDLSTLTEAIHFHGGEARTVRDAYFALPEQDRAAVIEFLKTLQILPEGSPRVRVEGAGQAP